MTIAPDRLEELDFPTPEVESEVPDPIACIAVLIEAICEAMEGMGFDICCSPNRQMMLSGP